MLKIIKKSLMNGDEFSSFRVKSFFIILGILMIFFSVAFYIVYSIITENSTLDFSGISTILTSLVPILGVVLHYKVNQKKVEINAKQDVKILDEKSDKK